jgi:KDO2-lipid IV(A) lauroyltransferase|tara:strand:- start:1354 stop:2214 length:861 start_codon:yes stop_codon:yes gene_type:complete
MKIIKYFFEFIFIYALLIIFKIIGYKNASNLGAIIGKKIGPLFRSNTKIQNNLENSNIGSSREDRKSIINNMWGNYGRILAEYVYLKQFRKNNLNQFIEIEGLNYLNEIKNNNEQAVFISGHFNNFELMAMEIEKAGINLCAIYRPLNNPFLNIIMENIRKNYICKNQIKKGKSGTRDLLNFFKKDFSVALMIDQRVSEGEDIDLFNRSAKTTTIPAQLVKKYGCSIISVYIERVKNYHFKLYFNKPVKFDDNLSHQQITLELNKILEKMILKNPDQWIWSHDRWK